MINTAELRIGNYVVTDSGVIRKVTEVSDHCINKTAIGRTEDIFINPIHLTIDLLLKYGFHYGGSFNDILYLDLNGEDESLCLYTKGYNGIPFDESIYVDFNDGGDGGAIKTEVKYLHQLQNLYYAITGKELEVHI